MTAQYTRKLYVLKVRCEGSALSAEMGKILGGEIYGTSDNLFNKDDPTNGQMSYFGRSLSHKIYITSRTFYAKGIRALLTYNASNTQLTATTSTASSGGAMRKFTIADDVDFAYIRVGYTDTTFVADNENVVNNYYYGNYCEKLNDSINPKYFNIIDPTADGFGVDTLYGYTLSNMLFVKDVDAITLKGVAFYEFYDENLTAIRHGQGSSLTKIWKLQPSGAYWLRVGCSTIAQLEDSFVALFDITLNVGIPTMGEFVPFVLSEINKTSNYNSTKIAVGGDSIAHGYNDETTLGGWSGRVTTALGAELVSYTYPGAAVCKRTNFPDMDQYSLVERSKQIAQSADEYSAILLAYGTNDFGNATPISPLADVIATSEDEYNFTSALYYSLKRIIDAKPEANIFVVNLLARTDNSPNDANAYNSMLEEVANYFALPILDVRHNSGINPNIATMKTAYMPDGLHPNGAGYEKIAKYIVQSIKDWVL